MPRRFPVPVATRRACAAGLLVLCTSSHVAAQTPVPPPRDPLAPGAVLPSVTRVAAPRHLDFNVSVSEGYDFVEWNADRLGTFFDTGISQNSTFSALTTSLSYSQLGEEKTFHAQAGADLRYYSLQPGVLPSNFYGGAAISTRLGKRVSFQGSANFGYSPFYGFSTLITPASMAEVRVPSSDQNIARLDTYTSGGSSTLWWLLSRRSSIYGGYTLDYVTTPNAAYQFLTQGATAGFQRQLSRYLSLRLGYGFRRSEQYVLSVPHFDMHTIDTGVGYRRPISSSRRTIVGFSVGAAVVDEGRLRSYTVTGDGSLSYQLNRTWTTGVFYQRNVGKIGGLLTPFVYDAFSGSLAGLWTRRFGFTGSGGYTRGSSTFIARNTYDSIYASGRFHYDLTRHLPFFVEYVYYRYEFSQTVGLATGFPLSVQRHGVRGGLGYSIPLVGQRL